METEVVLLRRFARTGDAEAFGEIIRRHAGLVYGAAWRILADMDRASDVAQETFLQLTKDAAKVTGSLPGWLHRVATHKAIDLVRRDTSRRHRETRYAAVQPREATSWREISVHVDEGLNALDAEMREILVAHFLEGQSTRQIAGVRGISQATVSRRLEAGVVTLRGRLRKRGLLVAAGTLSMLLGERAVSAAPAALKAELGKMALVGGAAAAVSASGAAVAAGTWSGVQTVIEGALAGGQAKAIAAAVVAAISVGSVLTYCQMTKPSAAEPTSISGTARSARVARAGVSVATGNLSAADRIMTAAGGPVVLRGAASVDTRDSDSERNFVPVEDAADPSAEAVTGGLPTAIHPVAGPGGEAMDQDAERALVDGGEGPYTSRIALAVPGPNDANDPNDESSRDLDRK